MTTPATASHANRLTTATTRAAATTPPRAPLRLARPARMRAGMARTPAVTRETRASARAPTPPGFEPAPAPAGPAGGAGDASGERGAAAAGGREAGRAGVVGPPPCGEPRVRSTTIGRHGSGSASA